MENTTQNNAMSIIKSLTKGNYVPKPTQKKIGGQKQNYKGLGKVQIKPSVPRNSCTEVISQLGLFYHASIKICILKDIFHFLLENLKFLPRSSLQKLIFFEEF